MVGKFCSSSGACSWISTLSKMFCRTVQKNHKDFFSLQQNFTSDLALFPACLRCFILLLVCFLICFSNHLGRKHLHTSRNFMHFVKKCHRPGVVATRKTTLWFPAVYKSLLSSYYVYYYHISMARVLLLHWKTHCGLEYNTNTICFIYIIATSGLPQNQSEPVWFRMQS